MLCLTALSSADNAAARSADLQQARRANLQTELANLQQEQTAAADQIRNAINASDMTTVGRLSTARMERQKRIDEILKNLEEMGSGASTALATAPRLAAASSTPSWKGSSTTQSFTSSPTGGTTSAPTARAPSIITLDEASAKLGGVNEFGIRSSAMSRRGAPATTSVNTPSGTAGQSDLASLAGRRAISENIRQRQEIGREQDALQRSMAEAQRAAAMAERTGQYEQAQAAQAQAVEISKQYQAAIQEGARLDQNAQFIANEMKQPNPDQNVRKIPGEKGLLDFGPLDASLPDDGTFRGGDELELTVAEDPSLAGVYPVSRSGVGLPNAGRVNVVGMTDVQAEDAIKKQLEATLLRTATVTVVRKAQRFEPQRREGELQPQQFDVIYLAGEFITPGPLRIPPNVVPTLLQTIIRSGGITPSGDLTRVKLLRVLEGGQGHVEEINVAAVLSGEVRPSDFKLFDGDIIVIPPFAPVVYVTGNVEAPGTLRLFQDETLTAYAAILRAGGFARFAKIRGVYVVRDLGNGEKAHIPVNIRDVQKGKAPDVILQGKDIVVVPERFFSF